MSAADCYWPTQLVQMLRVLIDDLDETSYTSEKLTHIILTAASIVRQEIKLSVSYTVDNLGRDISPDPCDPSSVDYDFINMIVLKAACIIDSNSARLKASQEGFRATCGPMTAEVKTGANTYQLVFDHGPCKTYAEMREKINFRDPMEQGTIFRAILSPFVSNQWSPEGRIPGRPIR